MSRKPKRRQFSKSTYQAIRDAQKGCCAIGGDPLVPGNIYYDHIVPLGMGGKDEEKNLQALCGNCHSVKTFLKIDGDISRMAKARRIMGQGALLKPKKRKGRKLQGRGFDKRFKKKLDGSVERR